MFPHDATILDIIYQRLLNTMACLSDSALRFCVQAALIALLPAVFCSLAYIRNFRVVPLQLALAVIGVLTAFSIPLQDFRVDSITARLWLVAVCILILTFLPPLVGFLTGPNPDSARKITIGLYCTITLLVLLQFLMEIHR